MQESCSHAWALAAALACAVTTESTSEGDAIAKKGSESLFSVISKLVPQVTCAKFAIILNNQNSYHKSTIQKQTQSHVIIGTDRVNSATGISLRLQICDESGRCRNKKQISEAELNKLLQRDHGFRTSRLRKRSFDRCRSLSLHHDAVFNTKCCSIFGDRLFTGRRWLQPTHAPDRALLDAGYDDLCAHFSAFAVCPRDRFLQTLADVTAAWSIKFTDRGARQSLADHAPAPTLLLPQTAVSAARQEVYGAVAEWDSSHWPLHGPRERTGGHSGPGQGTLKDVATPGSVKQASKDKTKIWHDNPIFMLGPRF